MSARRYEQPLQQQPTERELVLRQVQRLRAQGRTPNDIASLLGMNPADVVTLVYGHDPDEPPEAA